MKPNRTYFKSTYGDYNHSGDKYTPCPQSDYYVGSMMYCGYYDGLIQCGGYAHYVQSVLFGKTESGRVDGAPGGSSISYQTTYYPSKAELMRMPVGTLIYTTPPKYHYAILLKADSKGLTVTDCNVNWHCKISLRTIPWSKLTTYNPGINGKITRATYPTASTYPKSVPVSIMGYTTTDVNLRSDPGTQYRILYTARENMALTILDKGNPSWYFVKLSNGLKGYMSRSYVRAGVITPPKPPAKPAPTIIASAVKPLRLYKEAGTTPISAVDKGVKVQIISRSNKSWYKVKLSSGKTGYLSSRYLKIISQKTLKTTDPLRLRAGAGTNYATLTVISKGTRVTVLDTKSLLWFRVKTSTGRVGYMCSTYLE